MANIIGFIRNPHVLFYQVHDPFSLKSLIEMLNARESA